MIIQTISIQGCVFRIKHLGREWLNQLAINLSWLIESESALLAMYVYTVGKKSIRDQRSGFEMERLLFRSWSLSLPSASEVCLSRASNPSCSPSTALSRVCVSKQKGTSKYFITLNVYNRIDNKCKCCICTLYKYKNMCFALLLNLIFTGSTVYSGFIYIYFLLYYIYILIAPGQNRGKLHHMYLYNCVCDLNLEQDYKNTVCICTVCIYPYVDMDTYLYITHNQYNPVGYSLVIWNSMALVNR